MRLASSGYFDSAFIFVDPEVGPRGGAGAGDRARGAAAEGGAGPGPDHRQRAARFGRIPAQPGAGHRLARRDQAAAGTQVAVRRRPSGPRSPTTTAGAGACWRAPSGWTTTSSSRTASGCGSAAAGPATTSTATSTCSTTGPRCRRSPARTAPPRGHRRRHARSAPTTSGPAATSTARRFPRSGFGLGFELGGGLTLTGSKSPFQRTVVRWLGIRPLQRGPAAVARRGRRGAGASPAPACRRPSCFAPAATPPCAATATATSASSCPAALVGPGRFMAVGSVEWQRPIRRDGLPDQFRERPVRRCRRRERPRRRTCGRSSASAPACAGKARWVRCRPTWPTASSRRSCGCT